MNLSGPSGDLDERTDERHPEWEGREWIGKGVGCLCAERLTPSGGHP
jgi:hypothetical protein